MRTTSLGTATKHNHSSDGTPCEACLTEHDREQTMTPDQHIGLLTLPFNQRARYAHRPAPTGLHAKMLRELSADSPYTIRPHYGTPNHIRVQDDKDALCRIVWTGHRDLMPTCYRGAFDPYRCLARPASD